MSDLVEKFERLLKVRLQFADAPEQEQLLAELLEVFHNAFVTGEDDLEWVDEVDD